MTEDELTTIEDLLHSEQVWEPLPGDLERRVQLECSSISRSNTNRSS
jgi:hypothetical protein